MLIILIAWYSRQMETNCIWTHKWAWLHAGRKRRWLYIKRTQDSSSSSTPQLSGEQLKQMIVETLAGNQIKEVNLPENTGNVQIFSYPGLICLFCQYLKKYFFASNVSSSQCSYTGSLFTHKQKIREMSQIMYT